MMPDYPIRFFLNGEGVPNPDAALRLLPEIEAAPSLDYVPRNWSNKYDNTIPMVPCMPQVDRLPQEILRLLWR